MNHQHAKYLFAVSRVGDASNHALLRVHVCGSDQFSQKDKRRSDVTHCGVLA
jgi:hypothetical protein